MSDREVPDIRSGSDSSSRSNRKRKGARYLVYDDLQGTKFFEGEFGDSVKTLAMIRTWEKAIVRDHELFGRCVVRKFGSNGSQISQICDLVTNANREVECTPEATRHPNIVDFWGYLQKEDEGNTVTIGLVVEYMPGGSIEGYMNKNEPFLDSQETCLRITLQIARALAFCHEKLGLIHRNIQPSKILLSSDQRTAKLGNFGYSRRRTKDEQNRNNWTAKYPFEGQNIDNHLMFRQYLMNDNNRPNIDENRVHYDLQSIIADGWKANEDHRPFMNDIVNWLAPVVKND